jgi:hypothetical protein
VFPLQRFQADTDPRSARKRQGHTMALRYSAIVDIGLKLALKTVAEKR